MKRTKMYPGLGLKIHIPGMFPIHLPKLFQLLITTLSSCACDIPANAYTYSFEPNPNWSSVYAGSKEISQYFVSFCKKYQLHKYIKLAHQVSSATWDDKKGIWDVEITNLADGTIVHDACDILINAAGVLNAWKWPAIPGLKDFKGTLLHTARWDSSVDLEGKNVGLIGNGYVLSLFSSGSSVKLISDFS
jgi:cation diffusion facilitator CzcD-associated flavoprotein CzcO